LNQNLAALGIPFMGTRPKRIAAAGSRMIILANLRDANQITDTIRSQCVQADQQAMGGRAFGVHIRKKRPRG
jgi:hypothetical protein